MGGVNKEEYLKWRLLDLEPALRQGFSQFVFPLKISLVVANFLVLAGNEK